MVRTMTRLGRLTCLFIGIATGVCLGAVPMTWPALQVLAAWCAALLIALGLAILIDDSMWRRDVRRTCIDRTARQRHQLERMLTELRESK